MNKYLALIIIALWSFTIYFNSLSGEFVFDDESVVQNNISIQSVSNIPKFFTADEGFHKVIGRYYRPVVSTTYTIDYALWGLNPFGYHLTNILIHLFSCVVLFFILLNLLRRNKNKIFISFLSTMLFASHTVHTEAISWISGRTDSIVTLFFFLSLLFYIKYAGSKISEITRGYQEKSTIFLILSLVFYFLGLLSKEMIITMPVIIFLYDFFFKQENSKSIHRNFKVYLYFIAVTFLYLIIRYLALLNVPEREKYFYFYGIDTFTIIATMLKTIPVYFKLLFLPVNLIYHYNGVILDVKSIGDLTFIFSAFFIVVLLMAGWFTRKSYGEISFSIYFFLVSLIPVLNIIPTMNLMAERFLYLTSFIIPVITCFILVKVQNGKYYQPTVIFLTIIIVAYSYLTYQRNKDWQSNDVLYSTGEGKDGTVLLVNSGNIYANKKNFDEAAKRYKRALEIRNNNVLAHHNLGLVYLIKGNLDSAEYRFKKGIEVDSLAPDGYLQLSNLYRTKGNIEDAIKYLEKLQTVVPDYRGSSVLLKQLKDSKETGNRLPDITLPNAEIANLQNKSFELFNQRKFNESIEILKQLILKDPNGKAGYLNNIGLCFLGLEKYDNAENTFDDCLSIDPDNTNALGGKAEVLLKKKKNKEAIELYNRIMEINPNRQTKKTLDSLIRLK